MEIMEFRKCVKCIFHTFNNLSSHGFSKILHIYFYAELQLSILKTHVFLNVSPFISHAVGDRPKVSVTINTRMQAFKEFWNKLYSECG